MFQQLLDEVNNIQDPDIREFTINVVELAPRDCWRLPSGRDHHLKDEVGKWGNLIHTVRVIRICATLCDILDLDQFERDILRSAASLHDVAKHGINAEAKWIYKEHPQLVSALIDKLGVTTTNINHHTMIVAIIEQHMGRWGQIPCDWHEIKNLNGPDILRVTLSLLLHIADCIEARLPGMKVYYTDAGS